MIKFEVIATGSKGNAVVVNGDTLLDCGVPFKALKKVYQGLRLVLLTHVHGDHFNRTTIRMLAKERPTLRFAVPVWLASETAECGVSLQNIDVYTPNLYQKYTEQLSICMKKIPHNVPNAAWIVFSETGNYMYATDCNSLDGITSKGLDLYLIEANYTEGEIAERIRRKQESGEHVYEWDVLKYHLSKEKALDWLSRNMGTHSMYVLLHAHEEREVKDYERSQITA